MKTWSSFGKINLGDVLRGFLAAFIGGALESFRLYLTLDPFDFDERKILTGALLGGTSYILTQLPSNSKGEILKPEQKKENEQN